MDYKVLRDIINPFIAEQLVINESWGFLTLKGEKKNITIEDFNKLYSFLLTANKPNALKIKLDNDDISSDDLADFISNNTAYNSWEINLNKSSLLSNDLGKTSYFFCST